MYTNTIIEDIFTPVIHIERLWIRIPMAFIRKPFTTSFMVIAPLVLLIGILIIKSYELYRKYFPEKEKIKRKKKKMKKLILLLLLVISSSVCFSQEQEVKTDSCNGQAGLKLKTTVVYNNNKKNYTIMNKVEGGKIIDTIYLTVTGTNVDTLKTLKYIQPGNYRSRFVDERGCTIENIGWIYIDGHELTQIEPTIIKCFPNPFKNTLNVEYEIPITDKYHIRIAGVLTELDPYQSSIKIDTKKISVGVYIVELLCNNQLVSEYKVLKVK